MDDSAPLSLWLSVFCIELKDYRQGVLDPHRLASLTAGFECRLADCLKCRFIGTSADTAHDPGIFNLTLLIHDKLDIDPALFTCLFCRFRIDRKSTRLNSSHVAISYAVFCLKKKNIQIQRMRELS